MEVSTHLRPVHESHLVVQRQVTERWDVLGPFHQHQQLLLHGLAHVCDGGDLFGSDVTVQDWCGRRDLGEARSFVSCGSCPPSLRILCKPRFGTAASD